MATLCVCVVQRVALLERTEPARGLAQASEIQVLEVSPPAREEEDARGAALVAAKQAQADVMPPLGPPKQNSTFVWFFLT